MDNTAHCARPDRRTRCAIQYTIAGLCCFVNHTMPACTTNLTASEKCAIIVIKVPAETIIQWHGSCPGATGVLAAALVFGRSGLPARCPSNAKESPIGFLPRTNGPVVGARRVQFGPQD